MAIAARFALVFAACSVCLLVGFGPGEAGRGRSVCRADYRVIVWYSKSDPLGTFKYQIYDVRKGEDSPAVDRWLKQIASQYPDYIAISRAVDLSRERGEIESLKVGSVIKRELLAAAALAGVPVGSSLRFPSTPIGGLVTGRPVASLPRVPAIANPAIAPPLQPLFPVPVPFPRPHP